MAKLKIGSGIRVRGELPKLGSEIPKIGPSVVGKETSAFDVMALVEKAIAMLPKPAETQKEVDLSSVYKQMEVLRTDLFKAAQKMETRLNYEIHNLALQVDEKQIDLPEVKHVTHVQDISPEVLKQCKELIHQSEIVSGLKINDLQNKNKTQKIINLVLSGSLILTIFIHLL